MTNRYPRESIELVPTTVTLDGTAIVSGFELALTTGDARPTTWEAPDVAGTTSGYLLPGTLTPGAYTLWARVTDAPEVPVIALGAFVIS